VCFLQGSDDTHEKGDANEKEGAQGPAKSNNPADFGNDKIVLVQFEDGDPENPLNWSKSKKWVIVSARATFDSEASFTRATLAPSNGTGYARLTLRHYRRFSSTP
jgi:hypothetical protein